MRKTDLYDANGRFLRTLRGDEEDGFILADGQSLRTSLTMLDSVQRDILQHSLIPREPMRAPGFVQVADSDHDERERRFFDNKQKLSDAWKHAPALAAADERVKPADHLPPLTHDADAAYERRNAALERAYLGGA